MPVCSDPQSALPFSLEIDRKIDEASRPTFMLRFITEQEARKLRQLIREASEAPDDEAVDQRLTDAIRIGLVGVKNIRFRGEPVAVEDDPKTYLSPSERWELVYAVLTQPQIAESDRKKSASTQPSSAEPTAQSVRVENV